MMNGGNNTKMIVFGLIGGGLLGYGAYRMSPMGGPSYTLAENVATPVIATVQAAQKGRTVELTLHLTDANGKRLRELKLANGRRAAPPAVEIFDDTDERIYQGTFKYG